MQTLATRTAGAKKLVISTSVIDLDLRITFEDDWEDWVKGDEWNKLVEKASEGLTRKRNMQAKGKGKGKVKGTAE